MRRAWVGVVLLALATGCGPQDAAVGGSLSAEFTTAEEDPALEAALEQGLTSADATPLPSYPWPLAPTGAQHPVRGFLNDPRCPEGYDGSPLSFHFGIDVAGPDGAKVFAVEAGRVVVQAKEVIAVVSDNGRRVFSYWHLDHSAVQNGQQVSQGQQVGTIAASWGHVHLAEVRGGRYLNPLRRGAITPFFDYGAPKVRALEARQGSVVVPLSAIRSTVDVVVDAQDVTPVQVDDVHWRNKPVTPALLRARLTRGGVEVKPWAVVADLRTQRLAPERFHDVFAPGTDQNHPDDPGRYWFWVYRDWATAALAPGDYALEVEASDIRGNALARSFPLTLVR